MLVLPQFVEYVKYDNQIDIYKWEWQWWIVGQISTNWKKNV